jgi:iron(III) transport system ATP-binding protein
MTDIVVDNVRLRYGPVEVLKGVSFNAERGRIIALLGASGSGKTTLLRAIAGLEEPHSGRIAIDGRTLYDGAKGIQVAPEDRGLGLVFQSYALWPHKTVADNVAYPLRLRGVPKAEADARVQKALAGIGLGALGARFPHQLSGGQQQRVALARALVYEPKMILLDEPLSNLDAKLREEARVWLRQLITTLGLTAICVTHDQVEAMAIADRVLLLNGGRIEQDGAPRDIYERPRSLYAAEFMGSNNRIEGTVVSQEGARTVISAGGRDYVGSALVPLSPGEKAVGVIRVERVAVTSEPGPETVPAEVVDALYLGDRQEVVCKAGPATFRAFDLGDRPAGPCHLRFPPERLWIFPHA